MTEAPTDGPTTLLALDLAARTGWALLEARRIESGVQAFDLRRGDSPGMRYVRFTRWLDEIGARRPAVILYEQSHHRGGAATEIAAGFATRVQEWAARHGAEHAAIHSATLKKFATGSGRADKAAVLAAARARLGYAGADDNEADALWLLEYGRAAGLAAAPSPAERRAG